MIYDFGTPSHYYCIVKEVYSGDEIENFLKERESRSLRPRQPRSSTRNDPSNGHERSVVPLFFTRLLKRVINARLSVL